MTDGGGIAFQVKSGSNGCYIGHPRWLAFRRLRYVIAGVLDSRARAGRGRNVNGRCGRDWSPDQFLTSCTSLERIEMAGHSLINRGANPCRFHRIWRNATMGPRLWIVGPRSERAILTVVQPICYRDR